MLDKTQASVAQSTVVNATNLAAAISSKLLGVHINDAVHGQAVTRNTINRLVIEEIKKELMKEEPHNVV